MRYFRNFLVSFRLPAFTYLILPVGLALVFSACRSEDSTAPICDCPYEGIAGTNRISKGIKISGQDYSGQAKAELEFQINEWVKGSLEGEIKSPYQSQKVVETVYRNIQDVFPEKTYNLAVEEAFFCAYFRILCADETISESNRTQMLLSTLEELRAKFTTPDPDSTKVPLAHKQKKYTVPILSQPRGAEIHLKKGERNIYKGLSNKTLKLPAGEYVITISKEGYAPYQDLLEVPLPDPNLNYFTAVLTPLH